MKVTYTEKGIEHDFKRIDATKQFYAISYFQPAGTSLVYFKLNEYNIKTVPKDDILKIEN